MEIIELNENDDIGSILSHIETESENVKWFPRKPSKFQIAFRGESSIYKTALLPNLFRPEIYNSYKESLIFEEFQRQHPEYYQQCDNDLDWLNIMQHYGVPTRLLDWTFSLPVALYFAIEATQQIKEINTAEDDYGVLYFSPILPENNINPYNSGKKLYDIVSKLISSSNKEEVKKIFNECEYTFDSFNRDPFFYRPKYLHHRIRNQQGLFSVSIAKTIASYERDRHDFIISPDTGCVYLGQFPINFFAHTRIFSCVYEDEDKNIKKMTSFIGATVNSKFNDILMYVSKDGYIEQLWTKGSKKITSEIKEKPKLTENLEYYILEYPIEVTDFNKDMIYGVITWFLRDKNPYFITKFLRPFKEKLEEPYFDLASSQGIFKILIPDSCKSKLGKQLKLMGISNSLLYPEPSNFFKGFTEKM